jgi:hypothetical protein
MIQPAQFLTQAASALDTTVPNTSFLRITPSSRSNILSSQMDYRIDTLQGSG